MSAVLVTLAFASALGCGLIAGFFFACSILLMRGLARLPAPQAIVAMQTMNVVVINPWFMTALFGTALLQLPLIVAALAGLDESYAGWLLAGGLLYLAGVIALTMTYHVPRNDALARRDPTDAGAPDHWRRYLAEWTRWNHVRAVAPLIASGLHIAAIHAG